MSSMFSRYISWIALAGMTASAESTSCIEARREQTQACSRRWNAPSIHSRSPDPAATGASTPRNG